MNSSSTCRVGVNGGDPSAASKSTRRDRDAHGGIVAAKANLVTIKKTPQSDVSERFPARAALSRRSLCEAADGSPSLTPTVLSLSLPCAISGAHLQ
ncbi:hypothetical protein Y032_0003g1411 [Ancylostoma ceylanicum]|uniref:Uncharacterized protein n=1 Tax=Ancylostoma ceylanicum TaxID=53326 RepID=A0A016VX10_9BILA|nr:hypothetical protein Y032_0003g1411 [Ancylostoma ceylanicum]